MIHQWQFFFIFLEDIPLEPPQFCCYPSLLLHRWVSSASLLDWISCFLTPDHSQFIPAFSCSTLISIGLAQKFVRIFQRCYRKTWMNFWVNPRLRAGEGGDREWDGWMVSPTQWTWAWVNSRSWWWTGRPGLLRFMGLQGVRHDWAIELNYFVFIPAFILQLQHFWVHVIEKLCIHLIRASWVICLCSSIVTPCILLNYYYPFEWRMAHRNVLQLIIQVSCYVDMEMHCLNSQCCLN